MDSPRKVHDQITFYAAIDDSFFELINDDSGYCWLFYQAIHRMWIISKMCSVSGRNVIDLLSDYESLSSIVLKTLQTMTVDEQLKILMDYYNINDSSILIKA